MNRGFLALALTAASFQAAAQMSPELSKAVDDYHRCGVVGVLHIARYTSERSPEKIAQQTLDGCESQRAAIVKAAMRDRDAAAAADLGQVARAKLTPRMVKLAGEQLALKK